LSLYWSIQCKSCNLAMWHLAVCQKSHSKLKIPFQWHWYGWVIIIMPVYSSIMLALCFMLLVTYYATNYAGIISLGLVIGYVWYVAMLQVSVIMWSGLVFGINVQIKFLFKYVCINICMAANQATINLIKFSQYKTEFPACISLMQLTVKGLYQIML